MSYSNDVKMYNPLSFPHGWYKLLRNSLFSVMVNNMCLKYVTRIFESDFRKNFVQISNQYPYHSFFDFCLSNRSIHKVEYIKFQIIHSKCSNCTIYFFLKYLFVWISTKLGVSCTQFNEQIRTDMEF